MCSPTSHHGLVILLLLAMVTVQNYRLGESPAVNPRGNGRDEDGFHEVPTSS